MAKLSKKLPTKQEISELPRRAIVAFAARCARRVQPLFTLFWPDAPVKHKVAIEHAMQCAEAIASGSGKLLLAPNDPAAFDEAKVIFEAYAVKVNAADAAAKAAAAKTAAKVANAAAKAANAAALASFAAYDAAYAKPSYWIAYDAAEDAYDAYAGFTYAYTIDIAIASDLAKLQQAAKKEHWKNETPVPPEFFGPLWPEGEPDWKSIYLSRREERDRREDINQKGYQ